MGWVWREERSKCVDCMLITFSSCLDIDDTLSVFWVEHLVIKCAQGGLRLEHKHCSEMIKRSLRPFKDPGSINQCIIYLSIHLSIQWDIYWVYVVCFHCTWHYEGENKPGLYFHLCSDRPKSNSLDHWKSVLQRRNRY